MRGYARFAHNLVGGMSKYLVDTSVCVAHIRGDEKAYAFLKQHVPSISVVTHIELVQGWENKQDIRAARAILRELHELSCTESILQQALAFFEKYKLSHGIQFFDAVISSTAIEHGLTLITHNTKHFSFIPKLSVISFSSSGA